MKIGFFVMAIFVGCLSVTPGFAQKDTPSPPTRPDPLIVYVYRVIADRIRIESEDKLRSSGTDIHIIFDAEEKLTIGRGSGGLLLNGVSARREFANRILDLRQLPPDQKRRLQIGIVQTSRGDLCGSVKLSVESYEKVFISPEYIVYPAETPGTEKPERQVTLSFSPLAKPTPQAGSVPGTLIVRRKGQEVGRFHLSTAKEIQVALRGVESSDDVVEWVVEDRNGKPTHQGSLGFLLSGAIAGLVDYEINISDHPVKSSPPKQYQQMNEQEQTAYVNSRLKEVAQRMTKNADRGFPDEAVPLIKKWLDAYVRRIGRDRTNLLEEDLSLTFERATDDFIPTIIEMFQKEQTPILLGIYIPLIQTGYHNDATENATRAAGLFSFMANTARAYGIKPSERTNVRKMAAAAARYLKDRFAVFGTDITGIELSLLGYIRSPKSAIRDLKRVSEGPEPPTFWTLVKNKDKLDGWFQAEGSNYVPRFYAAAIIGESPTDFGIEMKPLSTYTKTSKTPDLIWGKPVPVRRSR